MNIFFLDWDTKKCAEYHCDKHVVKMILETAQLLCGAHHVSHQVPTKYPPSTDQVTEQVPYKLSHKNHPCAIWTRESLSNYLYLCDLGLELCKEYTYRYGKRHKSQEVIEWCLQNRPNIHDVDFTNPPLAMGDEYKIGDDVIESYRNYYKGAKKDFAKWKNRETPSWFIPASIVASEQQFVPVLSVKL
jgi:hypothetical protein